MNDSAAKHDYNLGEGTRSGQPGPWPVRILAAGGIAALAGVDETERTRAVIRALGVRECGHAAAILLGSEKLVWTRVAGDVLDVAVLAAGVARRGPGRRRRGIIAAAALSVIGGADVYAALRTTSHNQARHASGQRHHSPARGGNRTASAGGRVRLLAQPGKLAAVHASSEVGHRRRRRPVPLGG